MEHLFSPKVIFYYYDIFCCISFYQMKLLYFVTVLFIDFEDLLEKNTTSETEINGCKKRTARGDLILMIMFWRISNLLQVMHLKMLLFPTS